MDEGLIGLINRAKAGDKAAFGSIYKLYYKKVYRFIYFLVQDDQLAADLSQNTFLKMWQALPKFKIADGSIQAYLFTIARNLVTDFRRRKKEYTLDQARNLVKEDDILKNIEINDDKTKLNQVMQALDEDERQMLILRYFEELSMQEIARVVKKDEGAVRVRIHRLLKKLRETYSEKYAN